MHLVYTLSRRKCIVTTTTEILIPFWKQNPKNKAQARGVARCMSLSTASIYTQSLTLHDDNWLPHLVFSFRTKIAKVTCDDDNWESHLVYHLRRWRLVYHKFTMQQGSACVVSMHLDSNLSTITTASAHVCFFSFMSDSALVAPLSNIPTMSGMSHVMGLEQEVEAGICTSCPADTANPPRGGGGVGLHPRSTYQWSPPPPPKKKKRPLTSYNEVIAESQPTLRNQPI